MTYCLPVFVSILPELLCGIGLVLLTTSIPYLLVAIQAHTPPGGPLALYAGWTAVSSLLVLASGSFVIGTAYRRHQVEQDRREIELGNTVIHVPLARMGPEENPAIPSRSNGWRGPLSPPEEVDVVDHRPSIINQASPLPLPYAPASSLGSSTEKAGGHADSEGSEPHESVHGCTMDLKSLGRTSTMESTVYGGREAEEEGVWLTGGLPPRERC